MPVITLSTGVGKGGANKNADVRQVKDRLAELGFDWITAKTGAGPLTIKATHSFKPSRMASRPWTVPRTTVWWSRAA